MLCPCLHALRYYLRVLCPCLHVLRCCRRVHWPCLHVLRRTCCAPAYICRVCEDSAFACIGCNADCVRSGTVGMCGDITIALTRKQRTCPDRAGDRARRRRPAGRGQTASLVEMSTESAAAAGCLRRVVAILSSTAAAAAAAKSDSARRKSGPTVGLPATAARDSVRHLRPACRWLAPSDGSLPTEIHVKKNSSESTKSSSIFPKRHKIRKPTVPQAHTTHLRTKLFTLDDQYS